MAKKTKRNNSLLIVGIFILVLAILIGLLFVQTTGLASKVINSNDKSKIKDAVQLDTFISEKTTPEEINQISETNLTQPTIDEFELEKQQLFLKLADKENIIIEYTYSAPIITRDSDKYIISIPELNNLNIPGEPEVPFEVATIMLPADKDIDKVTVIPDEKIKIKGNYNIKTGDWQIPISQAENVDISVLEKNKPIFEKYTINYYSNPSLQIKKGYKFVIFNLYPVEYLQKEQKLSYYPKFTVIITLKDGEVPKTFRPDNFEDQREIRDWIISQNSNLNAEKDLTYERYQDISKEVSSKTNLSAIYSYPVKVSEEKQKQNAEDKRNVPNIEVDTFGFKYIIITKREFGSAFQPLINWKRTRPNNPITAKIFYMEDILADPRFSCIGEYNWGDGCGQYNQFNDNAARLRNFIRFAYSYYSTEYVLLGGDADFQNLGPGTETEDVIIPSRYIASDSSSVIENTLILSDVYFSNLDNGFDDDNDGIFSLFMLSQTSDNADYLPDIAIGRAPFDNDSEIINWVYKTITNEQIIDYADLNYQFVGEYLGFPGDNYFAGPYLDKLANGSTIDGFSTIGFSTMNLDNISKLYENYQNYNPPLNYGFSTQDLINIMNLKKPYIINHCGHGHINSVMKLTSYSEESNGEFLNLMDELTTVGYFIYSEACYAGAFDNKDIFNNEATTIYDSISEKLLALPTGPAAILSNSIPGGFNIFPRLFWDNAFFMQNKNIGKINNISKEQFYLRNQQSWIYLEKNLLGDPETSFVLPTLNNKLSIELEDEYIDAAFYQTDFNLNININNLTNITYQNIILHIYFDNQEISNESVILNPGNNQIAVTLNHNLYSNQIGEYKSIKVMIEPVTNDEDFDNIAEKILYIYNSGFEFPAIINISNQTIDCNTAVGQNMLGITDNRVAIFNTLHFNGSNFILKNCEFTSYNYFANSSSILFYNDANHITIEDNTFKMINIAFDTGVTDIIVRNNYFYTSYYNFPNTYFSNNDIIFNNNNNLQIYDNTFLSRINPRQNSNYSYRETIIIENSENVDINSNNFSNIDNRAIGVIGVRNSNNINLTLNNFESIKLPFGNMGINCNNVNDLKLLQNSFYNQKVRISDSNLVAINNNQLSNSNVYLYFINGLNLEENNLLEIINPKEALLTLHNISQIDKISYNKICTSSSPAMNFWIFCSDLCDINTTILNNKISSIDLGSAESNCPDLLPQHGINYCYCNEIFAPGGIGCIPDLNYLNTIEMEN